MHAVRLCLAFLLSASIFLSVIPNLRKAAAQDLVATEDLATGGSSVFVFRDSRKKPQVRAAGGRVSAAGGAHSARSAAQIAAAQKKRGEATRRRAAIAAANRKIALSNTLAAKGDEAMDSNQTDLAVKDYKDALAEYPRNTHASEGLSNALTSKGITTAGDTNNEAAIVYFDEAIKWDKQNDVAYAKLGDIHYAKGRDDQAITNYEQAVRLNPDYTDLYPSLGMAYLNKGEIAKAENALTKADGASIDTIDTRYLRAMLLFKQNKNAEALAAFDRTLELNPNYSPALDYRGQVLDRMAKPDEAVAAYKKAADVDPSNSAAAFDLGVAYYNKGDYNNAAASYQQVIKSDPNNYQAHANLASTYRQLERFADANAEFKIASTGIKTPDLYSEWGYCLGKTNEWDQSVARLNTAKEMSPTAIDNSNVGWAYYNEGNAAKAAKNDAAAKTDFEQSKVYLNAAVQQDPKLDAAFVNLGSTHNALGEFQEAVRVLNIALGLHSNWALAINQLGLGYRGLSDLTNAIATFKQVVDLDKTNVRGLYNLGEAYHASGNNKEAKKVNDRLKKIDPTLASTLDNVIAGRVVNAATQQVENKIPKPRIPRIPY